jgi:hypothetical protein
MFYVVSGIDRSHLTNNVNDLFSDHGLLSFNISLSTEPIVPSSNGVNPYGVPVHIFNIIIEDPLQLEICACDFTRSFNLDQEN